MSLKTENLISLGILIIVIGFIILLLGLLKGTKEGTSTTRVAIGGFIGPIPFGFGNDKNLVWFLVLLSIALFVIWLIFSYKFVQ